MQNFLLRCYFSLVTESKKVFLEHLAEDLLILLKHDFIAKSQSKYLGKLKDTVGEGEFIVTEYFSENYTIHTKYKMKFSHNIGAKIKSRFMFLLSIIERTLFYVKNFVIFSENLKHDSVAVYFFNGILISHLKGNSAIE